MKGDGCIVFVPNARYSLTAQISGGVAIPSVLLVLFGDPRHFPFWKSPFHQFYKFIVTIRP